MLKIFKTVCFVFLITSINFVSAQTTNDSIDKDQLIINNDNQLPGLKHDQSSDISLKPKKIQPGLEIGTSFSYSPRNYYGPSFYVAPNITYYINPRFALKVGVAVERSNIYPLYETSSNDIGMLPMTRTFLYTKGAYMLSSRITVDGTVYTSVNNIPRLTKYSAPASYTQSGAIIGINYKLNRSLSFGFHMHMQNSSYPTQNSAFYNPMFGY